MTSLIARTILLLAVITPPMQMGCGGNSEAPPRFDDVSDTGEIFTTADGVRYRAQVIARNLELPWALAFAPDGRLFVTERPGRVRIVENGQLRPEPALTLTDVFAEREAGLLGETGLYTCCIRQLGPAEVRQTGSRGSSRRTIRSWRP